MLKFYVILNLTPNIIVRPRRRYRLVWRMIPLSIDCTIVAERIFDVAVEMWVAPVACRVVVVIIHDRRLKGSTACMPYRE